MRTNLFVSIVAVLAISCMFLTAETKIISQNKSEKLQGEIIDSLVYLEGNIPDGTSLDYSPDGTKLISITYNGHVTFWNIATAENEKTISPPAVGSFYDFKSTDVGYLMAIKGANKKFMIWDIINKRQVFSFLDTAGKKRVGKLRISPDGKYIAITGSFKKFIRVIRMSDGNDVFFADFPSVISNLISFSSDGKFVAASSAKDAISIWETATGKEISKIENLNSIFSYKLNSNGTIIVLSDSKGNRRFLDVKTQEELLLIPIVNTPVKEVEFSSDGKTIAISSDSLRLYNINSNQVQRVLKLHQEEPLNIKFSPDGKTIVVKSEYIYSEYRYTIWYIYEDAVLYPYEYFSASICSRNTISNVDFYCTSDGIFGLNTNSGEHIYTGNLRWPRGTENQYMFGSGFWFGTQKRLNKNDTIKTKLVDIGYNPNSAQTWFTPGLIADSDTTSNYVRTKYQIYMSSDFDIDTGEPFVTAKGFNWPLWISKSEKKYQYGMFEHKYVAEESKRNFESYPKGPLFVSDEDIVTIMKDTDLREFEGNSEQRRAQGYPLGLEVEQKVFSWGSGVMKDVVILSYILTNKSTDTLFDSYFGYVADMDILSRDVYYAGSTSNDRTSFYFADPSLNLGYGWTNTDEGELGKGFGYIGVSLIETPTIDKTNFLRKDKILFKPKEQIGIHAFPSWSIVDDLLSNVDRYNFMASGNLDADIGPGDKRFLPTTGPFHLLPGETCRLAVALVFALPAKGGEADGSNEDLTSLVDLLKTTIKNYYEFLPTSVANDTFAKAIELNIYPNPANEIINLPYELKSTQSYIIYNSLGKLVTEGKTIQEIGISQLQVGMYLLYIDGKVYKFLKR